MTRAPAAVVHVSAFLVVTSLSSVVVAARGDVERGRREYARLCSQCHGVSGEADGAAAQRTFPRPRVFKDADAFKFRKTSSDALPLREDLFDSISRGMPGTAMPAFRSLSERSRWDLVAYVESLSDAFRDPDELDDRKAIAELASPPPRPEATPESIAKGRTLYEKNQCGKCHGASGRGNGEAWREQNDTWDESPILPADLTTPELFRGGAEPFDLYRTLTAGLRGTPMPEYRDAMTPEDRWHLVNYVASLASIPAQEPGTRIVARRVAAIPEEDGDESWDVAPRSRIRTFPNVVEPPRLFWQAVSFLTLQALYTEAEIALRVQWDDRSESKGHDLEKTYEDGDVTIYRNADHPDQLAFQFPARTDDRARPSLFFGDRRRHANLWWWRGDDDWFREIDATGFGALAEHPADSQKLSGRVSHDDGRYTLVVRRSLTTGDRVHDVQFAPGAFVPIALHVWDGDSGELGQRRAQTSWYWLQLEGSMPTRAYVAPSLAFIVTFGLLFGLVRRERKRGERKVRDEG